MKKQVSYFLTLISLACTICATYAQSSPETEIQYLSGTGMDHTVDWEFFCSDGMNSGKWTKIPVPSCWELQGFGHYNYGRDYKSDKPYHDEHGLYKYKFHVPEDWTRREIKIVFEGVMTDAEVKINGKLAGPVHQGAFYEFKYSISDLLNFGKENLLEVRVDKMSENASINAAERNADFWIFGGIYRPVYLEVLPQDHIERVAIDAQANGNIVADVFAKSKKAGEIKAQILDMEGHLISDLPGQKTEKGNSKWKLHAQAPNIRTWNPENPNLYQLQVELLDKKGQTLHRIVKRIGFRTVEVRESDGIYVNGTKIKFKGVNRHSFYPTSGRTTSKVLSIEHVQMIKDMNMNAVRMSHYPPDVHFLDVCDSLGLFVIDEVCTWHVPYLDTEVGKKIIKETIIRDVNHPSILLWANGNESGWNQELDGEYEKYDIQQREVIHPWAIFGKTNTMHYPEYQIFAYDAPTKDKIYFPTEFMHGLYDGGHGAGLDDYWKLMWDMSLCAGGFLWDFADEGVVRTDKGDIIDTDGNHAADGIVGPYGEKEGSYFTVKEIWSPIYIPERIIRSDFNGIFEVENRYHFTDLDECNITAQWVKFKAPEGEGSFSVMSEKAVTLPALAPGMKGTFKVEMPDDWQSSDALYLTATDPKGMEIFTWSYPVKSPKILNEPFVEPPAGKSIQIETRDNKIAIQAGEISFSFSEQTGQLLEVRKGNHHIPLGNGPIMLGSKSKLESVTVKTSKKKVEILALDEPRKKYWDWEDNEETTQDFFRWTVYPDGQLDLHVEIRNIKMVKEYMGITFSFPEKEVSSMRWLGDGPYRVWRNRMKGTQFNVWENDYNNTITGQSEFVYPEFKGFFSSLYWAQVRGKNENGFTVYCHSPNTYLSMLTPDQPVDPMRGATVKDFPPGDISFLKNIPPIGTKFKEPSKLGPSGHEINYFGNDDEPLVFDLTYKF